MNIILLYTGFHCASFIRVLQQIESHGTEYSVIFQGKNINKKYKKKLIKEFDQRGVHYIIYESFSHFFMKNWFKNYDVMWCGNLRRFPSLLLLRRSKKILILDDGIGNIVRNGYLDPRTPEKNKFKQLICNIFKVPSYHITMNMPHHHFTLFDSSFWQQYTKIDLTLIFEKDSNKNQENRQNIFVCSNIKRKELERFIKWANQNFELANITHISFHPESSQKIKNKLIGALGGQELDTGSLLLEDYVLSVEGKISIVGQSNSTTELLKLTNRDGLSINCKQFYAGVRLVVSEKCK